MQKFHTTVDIYQQLLDEWDYDKNTPLGITTDLISYDCKQIAYWRCAQYGHSWETRIQYRAFGEECPYCSHVLLLRGFNDLATVAADKYFLTEWNYIDNMPLEPKDVIGYSQSSQKVYWTCPDFGHVWSDTLKGRFSGNMCTICSGKKLLKGFNNLSCMAGYEFLCRDWHPTKNEKRTPDNTTRAYGRKLWWACSANNDHEWEATMDQRIANAECPLCLKERTCRDFNKAFSELTGFVFSPANFAVTVNANNGKHAVDVTCFNSELNLVIIFDDELNHGKNSPNRNVIGEPELSDSRDTIELLNAGYRVIRIRENAVAGKLPLLRVISKKDYARLLNSPSLKKQFAQADYKTFGYDADTVWQSATNLVKSRPDWFTV